MVFTARVNDVPASADMACPPADMARTAAAEDARGRWGPRRSRHGSVPAHHGIRSEAFASPGAPEGVSEAFWSRFLGRQEWRYSYDVLCESAGSPQSRFRHSVGDLI